MENNYENNFEQPVEQMNVGKKNNKKLFIIPAVCLVLVLAAVLFVMKSGVFANPAQKVEKAVVNTFKDSSTFIGQFDVNKINNMVSSGKWTVDMGCQTPMGGGSIAVTQNEDIIQLNADVNIAGMENIDLTANLNDKELQLGSSLLENKILTYNYLEESEGLFSQLLAEMNMDTATFNSFISEIYGSRNQTDDYKDVMKILKEEMDALVYEKAEKEELTVGGKNVKCAGFSTTVSSANVKNIVDKFEALLKSKYGETYKKMGMDVDTVMASWHQIANTEFEANVKFYIYKDKLSAIMVEYEGETVKLLLKGEENRTYDMEIVAGDNSVVTIEGSNDGTTETYTINAPGLADGNKISYNSETKEYEINLIENEELVSVNGKLSCTDNEFMFSLENLEIPGEEGTVSFEYALSDKSELKEVSGEAINVNTITEDEFLELYQSIGSVFMPY